MRKISEDEKKLIVIMETYCEVSMIRDTWGNASCQLSGKDWAYVGFGALVYDEDYQSGTPITDAYQALDNAMWNSVKELSGQ
jgi:hypothetical protein